MTVEEHVVDGGLGGLIAETCLEAGIVPRAFQRIGLRAGFSSIVGSQEYLRGRYGMDETAIVAAAKNVLRRSGRSAADLTEKARL